MSATRFSDLEIQQLKRIVNTTWQYVGDDLPGPSPHRRDAVFEVSVDAERLYIGCSNDADKALVKRFYALSWEDMIKLAPELLPFERYE